MGFGICFIASLLLFFDLFGSEAFAFALFGYGGACLLSHDRRFRFTAYYAGLAVIPAAFKALNVFSVIDLSGNVFLGYAVHISAALFTAMMFSNLFLTVKKLALEGGDSKLAAKSGRALTVTIFVLSLDIITQFFNNAFFASEPVFKTIITVAFLLRYFMYIYNSYFLYCCFASFTTPALQRKEQKENRALEEKQRLKKEKSEQNKK